MDRCYCKHGFPLGYHNGTAHMIETDPYSAAPQLSPLGSYSAVPQPSPPVSNSVYSPQAVHSSPSILPTLGYLDKGKQIMKTASPSYSGSSSSFAGYPSPGHNTASTSSGYGFNNTGVVSHLL